MPFAVGGGLPEPDVSHVKGKDLRSGSGSQVRGASIIGDQNPATGEKGRQVSDLRLACKVDNPSRCGRFDDLCQGCFGFDTEEKESLLSILHDFRNKLCEGFRRPSFPHFTGAGLDPDQGRFGGDPCGPEYLHRLGPFVLGDLKGKRSFIQRLIEEQPVEIDDVEVVQLPVC